MFKWISNLLRKKHKVADFSQLEPHQQIPTSASPSVDGLGLTNPDAILSGQNRGTQSIGGSANIQSDPSGQRMVVNDNSFNRVAFGRIGTGVNDWGMKVSKPGIAVDTATNDQLIFNSSQNVFKIVSSGTLTSPSLTVANPGAQYGSGTASAAVTHNLGYIPAVLAYISQAGQYYALPFNFSWGGGTSTGQRWAMMSATVDSSTFYVSLDVTCYNTSWTNANFSIKYYLLQETAN